MKGNELIPKRQRLDTSKIRKLSYFQITFDVHNTVQYNSIYKRE